MECESMLVCQEQLNTDFYSCNIVLSSDNYEKERSVNLHIDNDSCHETLNLLLMYCK